MRFRRPATIAASIAVLAVAVPLTLYLVQAPRVADQGGPQAHSQVQEQPLDKVAALSKPAPAESPAPPTAKSPASPLTAQIVTRPNSDDQRRLPDEDARSLIFDDTLLFDIDKFSGYDRYQPGTRADYGREYKLQEQRQVAGLQSKAPPPTPPASAAPPPYLLLEWPRLPAEPVACETVRRKGPSESLTDDEIKCLAFLRSMDRWSVLGQARYDIDADQRIQDVYPFKFHEDECFVLTASYIETFVENAALDLLEDRTLMLRYELKGSCQYGYRTDALSHFFYDIHREIAPTSGGHVATAGAIPAEKAEACPPGGRCTLRYDLANDTDLVVAADWKRKMVDPIGQEWTPFANVHGDVYSFSGPTSATTASPPTVTAGPDLYRNTTPGKSSFPQSKDGIFGPRPKIDRASPVYLQTDRLVYDDKSNRVIAEGNVEIYYNNYILIADKVIYDQSLNKLTAEGNAQLKDPNGSVTRADRFEATDDFRDAFIQSLSVITTDDTVIAARSTARKEGNVTNTVTQDGARKVAVLPKPKAQPQVELQQVFKDMPVVGTVAQAPLAADWRKVLAGQVGQDVELRGRITHRFDAGEHAPMPPPPTQDGRDRFATAAANPVKSVASEPVSTFSIDVDSASYSFVRRALNSGQLPPKEAVRVEEMINYFPYDYPLPDDRTTPFRPTVSVLPSPWNPANKLVHIAIKGYDVAKSERPRANLVLLIDTSGSMAPEDRLPLLKNAFRMLIDTLRPDDTVGIVTYAGQTHVALEPTKVADKRKILDAIERLHAGGSTAGGAGIQEAYRMAEGAFDKAAVNRVILATDGDFNVGITSVDELKSLVERKRETGIHLSVLGVGRGNYNDALMQALAQNGNGVAAYIDTLSEARKVLVDEVSSTLFSIAKDVKTQIEFNPAVVAEYRLIGYETRLLRREDFNNDKVDAGDIGSGHTVIAIYEVTPVGSPKFVEDLRYKQPAAATPKDGPKDGMREYAFLRINYKLPAETVSRRIELPITPALEKAAIDQVSTEIRFSVAVAAFGQLLRGDPYLKGFGYDEVIALAAAARGEDLFGYRAELLNLVRLAKTARP
jgi:Ca-activated chloride channel homolog